MQNYIENALCTSTKFFLFFESFVLSYTKGRRNCLTPLNILTLFEGGISTAQEQVSRLDELAAPTSYVAPSTEEELGYLAYFRQVCKRYNIVFADADSDERDFSQSEWPKGYYPKRA